jgi:hypothetical protein
LPRSASGRLCPHAGRGCCPPVDALLWLTPLAARVRVALPALLPPLCVARGGVLPPGVSGCRVSANPAALQAIRSEEAATTQSAVPGGSPPNGPTDRPHLASSAVAPSSNFGIVQRRAIKAELGRDRRGSPSRLSPSLIERTNSLLVPSAPPCARSRTPAAP